MRPQRAGSKYIEKLFDRFGDTVIGYDAEKPEVIEDYREELRGMIRK